MRFWSGFAAGVAVTTAAAFGVIAWTVLSGFRSVYDEFQHQPPAVTALVTSPAWSWGVPIAIVAMVVAVTRLVPDDRRRIALLIALAVLAVAALVFTLWAAYLPLFQLTPPIGAG